MYGWEISAHMHVRKYEARFPRISGERICRVYRGIRKSCSSPLQLTQGAGELLRGAVWFGLSLSLYFRIFSLSSVHPYMLLAQTYSQVYV